ncbi:MAG: hypothetical protein OXU21_06345 [Chloroflexota bacterium]|nr:hypothetical protein [Chloroflexota bacterium]
MRWISARAAARALVAAMVLTAAVASGVLAHEGRESAGYDLVVGFLNEPAYEGYLNAVFLEVTKTGSQAGAQEPHDMAGGHMTDVMAHGGIFVSTPFADGDAFEAEIPHDLDGMTIPYHSHLNPDIAGLIEVSRDAPAAGRVDVELHPSGAAPHMLRVQPGAAVAFLNRTGEPQLIASGMHTDEAHAAAGLSGPVTGLEDTLQVEVTHISSGQSMVMALAPLFEHPGAYTADFIPTQPGGYRFRFFGSIEGQPFDEAFESGANTFDAVQSRAVAQFPVALPSVRELEGVVRGSQASADDALDEAAGARVIGIVGIVVGAIGLATAAGAIALAIRSRRGA